MDSGLFHNGFRKFRSHFRGVSENFRRISKDYQGDLKDLPFQERLKWSAGFKRCHRNFKKFKRTPGGFLLCFRRVSVALKEIFGGYPKRFQEVSGSFEDEPIEKPF